MDIKDIEIAGYSLKQKIGSGGMSVVYLAEQDALKRQVALKIMRPQLDEDSHILKRFIHEAEVIAKLYHPNVVSIYDVGHVDQYSMYYTMPYYPCGDLNDRMLETESDIQSTFLQICEGLDYAHEQGVVHRDLKPENILFDEHQNAQIADFGIALSPKQDRWTRDNHVLGSLHYMSPEQAQSHDVDARSDIYALGAMLYESLSGEVLFPDKDELALMVAHVNDKPALLPREKRHWQPIIDRCLAKSPNKRYQKVSELRSAIAAVDIHSTKPKKVWAPRWVMATAVAIMTLALVWIFWSQDQGPQFIDGGQVINNPPTYEEPDSKDANNLVIDDISELEKQWQGVTDHTTATKAWLHTQKFLKSQPEVMTPLLPEIETQIQNLIEQDPDNPSLQQLMSELKPRLPTQEEPETTPNPEIIQKPPKNYFAVQGSESSYLAKYPVTLTQFRSFANATAMTLKKCKTHVKTGFRISDRSWHRPGFPQEDNHPVVCVTWQQAQAYAQWMSKNNPGTFRLPTAAEWQQSKGTAPHCRLSNRAGIETKRMRLKGDRYKCKDDHLFTSPVLQRKTQFAHMHGNVREWVEGCKEKNKIQSWMNDKEPCDSHPTLGQSWASVKSDQGDVIYHKSNTGWNDIGFRLVWEADTKKAP